MNKKPQIIISLYDEIDNPYYGGGGAISNHKIATFLSKQYNITIICGAFSESINRVVDGVEYKHIGPKFVGPLLGQVIFSLLLPFYAIKEKHDLWIENFVPPHSTNFITLFTKKPVIGVTSLLNAEKFSQKYKLPFYLIERLGLKTYKHFIVLTKEFEKRIRLLNSKTDIQIIPRGIDKKFFKIKTSEGDYILYLGRIDVFQKGIDLLIEAWHKIPENNRTVKLIIVGSGTAKNKSLVREMVRKHKLFKSVEFKGWVEGENKMKILSQSVCIVAPSRFEGFGNIALEALAMGKPFICFDIEGFKWIPSEICIKVSPFNTEEFSEKIISIIHNAKLRAKFKAPARNFAQNYDWNSISTKYNIYLKKIMNQDKPKKAIVN